MIRRAEHSTQERKKRERERERSIVHVNVHPSLESEAQRTHRGPAFKIHQKIFDRKAGMSTGLDLIAVLVFIYERYLCVCVRLNEQSNRGELAKEIKMILFLVYHR